MKPDSAFALAHRGATYIELENYNSARSDLHESLRITPSSFALLKYSAVNGEYDPGLLDLNISGPNISGPKISLETNILYRNLMTPLGSNSSTKIQLDRNRMLFNTFYEKYDPQKGPDLVRHKIFSYLFNM